MIDTECFAESVVGCRILIEANCEGCSFRKSQKEYEASMKTSYERLRGLPEEQQQAIAAKYYKNKKMWCDERAT